MENGVYLKQMGLRIKAIRLSKGLFIRQVCEVAKLDEGALSRIESGQKNSYLLTLKKIADALNVDVKDFL